MESDKINIHILEFPEVNVVKSLFMTANFKTPMSLSHQGQNNIPQFRDAC